MPVKTLADIVKALEAAGLDHLAHESVADFLYLAQHWDLFSSTARAQPFTAPPNREPQQQGQEQTDPLARQNKKRDTKPAAEEGEAPAPPKPTIFMEPGERAAEGTPAARISVADPAALPAPLLISRALRPLARRRPSRRDIELDEEATAEETAHRQFLAPVFRPVRERWFDVLLLIEDSITMSLWHRAIREFTTLLNTHGAFRDVRTAKLRTADSKVEIVEQSGRIVGPASILDPEGRRLTLLFTHGVAAVWAGGVLHRTILKWASRQPVSIVQMLPDNHWEQTELGEPGARIRAQRPGTPNAACLVDRPEWERTIHPEGAVVPVFTLRPQDIGRWARMVMAEAVTDMPAYFLGPAAEAEPPSPAHTTNNVSAAARISRFRMHASPEAWRLAVALAGSPLQLPILRLVQQTIFTRGEAQQSHLAELLLGGLMERVYKTDDPERDAFEFHPGVRELLAESLTTQERYTVRARVYDYIRSHQETLQVFPALVPHKDGTERLPQWASPFAEEDAGALPDLITSAPNAPVRLFSAAITKLAAMNNGDLAIGLADGWLEAGGKWQHGAGAVNDLQTFNDRLAILWDSGQYQGPGHPPPNTQRIAWLGAEVAFITDRQALLGRLTFSFDANITCVATLSTTSLVLGFDTGAIVIVHRTGVKSDIAQLESACTAIAGLDGNMVAAGGANGELLIWIEQPQWLDRKQHKFSQPINAIAWSPESQLACGVGNEVLLCDSDLQNLTKVGSHRSAVTALAWIGNTGLASGADDSTVRRWNFERRPVIAFAGTHPALQQALLARGHLLRDSLTNETRAIVIANDLTLPYANNDRCLPVVRYAPNDDPQAVIPLIDAALAQPPAGPLVNVPEPVSGYSPDPEAEAVLRKHIQRGAPLIAVLGEPLLAAMNLIAKVVRECDTRRRFPGGIYGNAAVIPDSVAAFARIDRLTNFSRDWPQRPGDVIILAGSGNDMARHLEGLSVAFVELGTPSPAPQTKADRLAEWCACRTNQLPPFIAQAIGHSAIDEELVEQWLLSYDGQGGVEVDRATHREHHGKGPSAIHQRIAAAIEDNLNTDFAARERLYHLLRSGQHEKALAVAQDVNCLIPALQTHDTAIYDDLLALGLTELVEEIRDSDAPIRARLAASRNLAIARAALRYQQASIYVAVAGTGAQRLNQVAQNTAEAVGLALSQAGFGLITGAWPGVDYVTAAVYLNSGGKSLAHALTQFSVERFKEALMINVRRDDEAAQKLADAVVLIGGEGGTLAIFHAARSLGKPVFPYGPSGGDAAKALLQMSELDPSDALRSNLSTSEFASLVVERLGGTIEAPELRRMWQLSVEYNTIRETTSPGDARTARMSDLFQQMLEVAPAVKDQLSGFRLSQSAGLRLAAIAILQKLPQVEHLDWLAERLENTHTEKPFVGYQAAVALAQAAEHLHVSDFDELEKALAKARRLGEKVPNDPGRLRVLFLAERHLMSKRADREPEADVTRLIQQYLQNRNIGDAVLTRNVLLYQTETQCTWLSFTTSGLLCTLDNRPGGKDYFRVQWFQRLSEISPSSIKTKNRGGRTGLVSINTKEDWLYSRQLFDAARLKDTILVELKRARDFRDRGKELGML